MIITESITLKKDIYDEHDLATAGRDHDLATTPLFPGVEKMAFHGHLVML